MMAAAIRALYVDDEPALLDIGKQFLEQSGDFAVTTATSAPDAIRLLEQEKFDTIISDYQMPEMDGIQFLVLVRTRFGQIPFIIFTGKGREEVVIQAINSGADFYLQKGSEPKSQFAELSHKIKQAASRKRADDALRKSEEKYRHLIEHSDEGIVVVQDGMPKLVNHRAVEFTGYPEQELLSMPFTTFINPDDRAMVMERYQKRLKGEEFLSRYAFRLSPKDGSTRWVEISVSAIDWEGLPATLNFLTDITERKRAEDALVESETKYHSIFDNAVMGIYQVSREGRFLSANNHAARTFGYESAEELILSITDINTQIYQDPKTGEVAKGILLEKGVLENFEVPCRHKDGQTIWVSFNARLVRDAYGNILYHEGTSQDITERKRAEEALRQVNKQLNLLSSITRHDIKNQVLALKGYIEISRDTLQDPKTLLRFLEGEELAANTIEYQITFTKNYQELGAAAPAWQNVNECIRKAMAALPMRAVHIEPDPADPDVYADPLIEKVFYNLIDNALKYGGDRMKMIRVSSQESDRGLTIVCEDDGVGISAEDKKRLFTRGFGKNTGLGLFLSREILTITGITITENGTPGKGARFEIVVPKGGYRIGMGPG